MTSDEVTVPEYLVTLAHRARPEWTEADHRSYLKWLGGFGAEFDAALVAANPLFALCQSPIERQFLASLLTIGGSHIEYSTDGFRAYYGQSQVASDLHVRVQPKVGVGAKSLTPDFGIGIRFFETTGTTHWLYVECDGHEYHSSKKDLARDKGRDRLIAATDQHVIRFTGSEIWANPMACADEAVSIIHRIAEGRSAA